MSPGGFAAFYEAVHGHAPFRWQTRLAETVLAGGWPAGVEIPTACGKTCVLDVAVYHLACEGQKKDRQAALRILFVVDRRLVVDGAEEHARKLAKAIDSAQDGVLAEARKQLEAFGGGSALEVVKLRGGMYRDSVFADRPNQPMICVSTVDQIGSKLLFRGYQVSDRQQAVHAGLAGRDSLLVVDEAHLSQPFVELTRRLKKWNLGAVSRPLRLVTMSATLAAESVEEDGAFRLNDTDLEEELVLVPRLRAVKQASLKTSGTHFESAAVKCAEELAKSASVVGVVVNTVASARKIFQLLGAAKKGEARPAVLLTGRVRPHDRDRMLEQYLPWMRAGREGGPPLYVVATQTVEVGADLDFDALVTEAAPLDSLRQRFGRLDRLGRRGASEAVVLYRKNDVVYGSALEETWLWLNEHAIEGVIDFGVAAMDRLWREKGRPELLCPRARLPLLFPSHWETWIQTNPAPHPDPDLGPFLHGPSALDAADVQIVWRVDLAGEEPGDWKEIVSAAPPIVAESLAMPIRAVRRWLMEREAETVADVEGMAQEEEVAKKGTSRKALRWAGPDHPRTGVVSAGELRPGDTIVVPCEYGGCDKWGWNPEEARTQDIGNAAGVAAWIARGRKGRLCWRMPVPNGVRWEDEDTDWYAVVENRLTESQEEQPPETPPASLFERAPVRYGRGRWVVFERRVWEESDEDDGASYVGRPVRLDEHLSSVASRAAAMAEGCGLSEELIADLRLAAQYHDIGKSDPRFQLMLRLAGGRAEGVLAKSGGRSSGPERRAARRRAGYPDGARHEFTSVSLLRESSLLEVAHDMELVLHLIGTHHGQGRSLAPVWVETERVEVEYGAMKGGPGAELGRLDSGWAEQFWRLNERYGYWGLAYLEAILRRADSVTSREESAQ